jgi:hypothetical protein
MYLLGYQISTDLPQIVIESYAPLSFLPEPGPSGQVKVDEMHIGEGLSG